MLSFGFIIPLRPRSQSADWEQTLMLLNRTIASVLKQTYRRLQVYVIYTDMPTEKIADERVQYIPFPYGFQDWESLTNQEALMLQMKSKIKAVRRWDKGRKVTYGSKLAKEAGCNYLMTLDSDDLLSCNFLNHLVNDTKNQHCAGWFMDCGYVYKEGSNSLMYVPRHMCGLNGSTHVLRADLVTIPDLQSLNWQDFNLFTDHGWVRERVRKNFQVTLRPIPKPMLVYVVHQSNMSQVNEKEFGFNVKALLKKLLRTRRLTAALRAEFSLPDKHVI